MAAEAELGPMPRESITWIHLSDFHGGPDGDALWPVLDFELESDVSEMLERLGAPDLVLCTGDLAARGVASEYARLDRLLERLEGWVGRPLPVVAVPGNHDVLRPRSPWRYVALGDYAQHPSLHRDLWEDGEPLLDPLFPEYVRWARRRMIEPLLRKGYEVHVSERVPGDVSVVFDKGSMRLGLVGLNTAWTHLSDQSQGRIELLEEQLRAALPPAEEGGDPLAWFQDVDAAFLLTHHPRGWFTREASQTYKRRIYPPGRFALALFGHQHQHWAEVASSVSRPRALFQAPSLYGLEHHGPGAQARVMGYAWGRRTSDGQVRVWPRRRVQRNTGRWGLEPDLGYQEVDDAHGGVLMAPAEPPDGS